MLIRGSSSSAKRKMERDPLHPRGLGSRIEEKHRLPVKFSIQTELLMKTQVKSMVTNWKLNETARYLKAVREKQSQNLVETQTRYEQLDADHQFELGSRGDSLNNAKTSKQICKVLCAHIEGVVDANLKEEIALGTKSLESFQSVFQEFDTITKSIEMGDVSETNAVQEFECKEKELREAIKDRIEFLDEDQRIGAIKSDSLKKYIAQMQNNIDFIQNGNDDLKSTNEQYKKDVDQKYVLISKLEQDFTKEKEIYSNEIHKLRAMITKKENTITEKKKEKETISSAFLNQESFTNVNLNKNHALQAKLSAMETEILKKTTQIEEKDNRNTDIKTNCKELETEISIKLLEIQEKNQELDKVTSELESANFQGNANKDIIIEQDALIDKKRQERVKEKAVLLSELEELDRNANEIKHLVSDMDVELTRLNRKITEVTEELNENTESMEKNSSEVIEMVTQTNKDLAEIEVMLKQQYSNLTKVLEEHRKQKKAEEKHIIDLEAIGSELNTEMNNIKTIENEINIVIKNMELTTKEVALLNEQIDILKREITSKDLHCIEQHNLYMQEIVILLNEKKTLCDEIKTNRTALEEGDALIRDRMHVLEDKIKQQKVVHDLDAADKMNEVSTLEQQMSTNASNIANLKSDLNRVMDLSAKSEATRERSIRDVAAMNADLAATKEEAKNKKAEQIVQNKKLEEDTQRANYNYEAVSAEHEKLKKGLIHATKHIKRKYRTDKKNKVSQLSERVAERPTSPVLTPMMPPQMKSPRLLKKTHKKRVQFDVPEHNIIDTKQYVFDYFSDSSGDFHQETSSTRPIKRRPIRPAARASARPAAAAPAPAVIPFRSAPQEMYSPRPIKRRPIGPAAAARASAGPAAPAAPAPETIPFLSAPDQDPPTRDTYEDFTNKRFFKSKRTKLGID